MTLWDYRALLNIPLLPGCLLTCILHDDSSIDVCGNLSKDGSSSNKRIATKANKELEFSLLVLCVF